MIDIVFDDAGTLIPLVLDASVEEKHSARATATEFEVEVGAAVSDHYRTGRRMLDVDVVISDTPIAHTNALGVSLQAYDIQMPARKAVADPAHYKGGTWQPAQVQSGDPAPQRIQVITPDSTPQRIADSWATLMDARDRALLATVTTGYDTYEDMALVDMTADRTAQDGTWLRAHLSFVELHRVSTQTVYDPTPARPRNHAPVDRGSQETTTPTPRLQSLAYQAFTGSLFP